MAGMDRDFKCCLPVVIDAPKPPVFGRPATPAAFLSQLIAERQHLMAQRLRRRAGLAEAVDAYRAGTSIAVRRMPAGYRKSLVA